MGTVTLRVRVVSASHIVAKSSPKRVRLGPVLVVKSKLRPTTAQDPADVVQSVSGSPSGTQTVVLARDARVPVVGGALVLGVSTRAPDGLLGVVTSISHGAGGASSVTTRPATLEEAYSSFDAQINGTLGELANEHASTAAHAADVSIGSFGNVGFSCDDPGVQHSITHTIDLSELHVSSEIVIPSWSNGFSGPFINFDLGGHPKFGLGVSFGGYASCTADATVNIPLADTGLFVEIGPRFTLGASGAVSVNMDWEPWVNFGFSRGRDDPSNNYEAFHNDGHTTFSGNADLNVSLALKAGISLAGRLGVGGTIGPEIIGEVSASTATRAACLTVDAEVVAELTAYADVFFDDYNFTLGRFAFGHTQLYHDCTGSGGGSGSGSGSGGGGSGGGGGSTPPGTGSNPPSGGGGPGGGGTEVPPESELGKGTAASPLAWSARDELPYVQGYPARFGNAVSAVSCGSPTLCVAVDDAGNAVISTTPLDGNWHVEAIDPQLGAFHGLPEGSDGTPGMGPTFYRSYRGLSAVSCPSARLCVATDYYGNVLWSTDPAGGTGAWHLDHVDSAALESISCPSEQLCLAGDSRGQILVSTNPIGGPGSWTVSASFEEPEHELQDHISAISCPDSEHCYAVDEVYGIDFTVSHILTTSNPTESGSNWTDLISEGETVILGLSCPTLTLCVADDTLGQVLVSTEPASPSSWTAVEATAVDVNYFYPVDGSVSCTADAFCAFGGDIGNIWTSNEPSGSWTADELADTNGLVISMFCRSATECVGGDSNGGLAASDTPTGTWATDFADPDRGLTGISCTKEEFCLAINQQGGAVSSSNATSEHPTWTPSPIDADNDYSVAVSCAGKTLCAAINQEGDVVTSVTPATGGWSAAPIAERSGLVGSLAAISCPSATLCVAVEGGNLLTSKNPNGGASAWERKPIDSSGLLAVSCPSTHLCVAVDGSGDVLTSTNPTAGAASWSAPANIDSNNNYGLYGVSCPTASLCVAVDGRGNVLTSKNPAGGAAAWSAPVSITGGSGLGNVSCSTESLCTAMDGEGEVVASTDPTGGASAWTPPTPVDVHGGVASLSCASPTACVAVDRNGGVITGTLIGSSAVK